MFQREIFWKLVYFRRCKATGTRHDDDDTGAINYANFSCALLKKTKKNFYCTRQYKKNRRRIWFSLSEHNKKRN